MATIIDEKRENKTTLLQINRKRPSKKDPEVMQRIKEFAEKYYAEHALSPSIGTICEGIGEVRSRVYTYLVEMDYEGILRYDGSNISTDKTEKMSGTIALPAFSGNIPCGSPEDIEASVEYYVTLPTVIFGKGDKFIIRTQGDSMDKAGILDGGYAVVERATDPKIGDLIVALTDKGENTLKRLAYDAGKKKYYLHPESTNPIHQDIYVSELNCQGIVRSIINNY